MLAGGTKIGIAGHAAIIAQPSVVDLIISFRAGMKEASHTRVLDPEQPDIWTMVKIVVSPDIRFPKLNFSTEFENGFHGPLDPQKGFGSIAENFFQRMLGCIGPVVQTAACAA